MRLPFTFFFVSLVSLHLFLCLPSFLFGKKNFVTEQPRGLLTERLINVAQLSRSHLHHVNITGRSYTCAKDLYSQDLCSKYCYEIPRKWETQYLKVCSLFLSVSLSLASSLAAELSPGRYGNLGFLPRSLPMHQIWHSSFLHFLLFPLLSISLSSLPVSAASYTWLITHIFRKKCISSTFICKIYQEKSRTELNKIPQTFVIFCDIFFLSTHVLTQYTRSACVCLIACVNRCNCVRCLGIRAPVEVWLLRCFSSLVFQGEGFSRVSTSTGKSSSGSWPALKPSNLNVSDCVGTTYNDFYLLHWLKNSTIRETVFSVCGQSLWFVRRLLCCCFLCITEISMLCIALNCVG